VVVPPARRDPVRIGGDVIPPKKIRDVSPTYPAIAQQYAELLQTVAG